MSKDILNLEPKNVWKQFFSLTQIPRPSKKEAKVIDFVYQFGKDLGLETIKDEVGNVIIKKPATKGFENRKGVILQAHLDMVPQKNSDTQHDFENDPIDAYVDGEWVTAKGTTLGADNGIGVAAIMAVLESNDLEHGPVEGLFTMDEETGMTGAYALKAGILDGDILINTDSEDEGELYIGCAGGMNANMYIPFQKESAPAQHTAFEIIVKGLKGGHSGIDIPLGRANANKILIRLLKQGLLKVNLKLSDISGGDLRNAIPREAKATVLIPDAEVDRFKKLVAEEEIIYKKEYASVEPDMSVKISRAENISEIVKTEDLKKMVLAVYGCPNGVMRMSNDMEGLVETSTNLAIVRKEKDHFYCMGLLRSSVDTAKHDLAQMMESVFTLAGAKVEFDGEYPGWQPNPKSEILSVMQSVYNNKFGKIPEIKAIHAGLECGILGATYPNWDMISFGPTIRFPHSPDEKVNIETVQKFWTYLVETLKNVPEK